MVDNILVMGRIVGKVLDGYHLDKWEVADCFAAVLLEMRADNQELLKRIEVLEHKIEGLGGGE